ncbi:response regulator transcription factor [Limnohabitans sp. yimb22184]|uniref:response regulator transcription factor n=1 Tax=Limnohabitans sp. YIMB22184 TaxID=3374104 RepID=UPI003A8B2543
MSNLSNDFDLRLHVPGVVAVVDDDAGIALALQNWLELMQVRVRAFQDGREFLSALESTSKGWHFQSDGQPLAALVIDLNLPGLSGFEVARRLQALTPNLCIVVITAASDVNMDMLGGVPPGVVCVGKPFNLAELECWLKPPYI